MAIGVVRIVVLYASSFSDADRVVHYLSNFLTSQLVQKSSLDRSYEVIKINDGARAKRPGQVIIGLSKAVTLAAL